jgi:hypothetical protein
VEMIVPHVARAPKVVAHAPDHAVKPLALAKNQLAVTRTRV